MPSYVFLGFLLLLSAFFSMSETSLVSFSRLRLKLLADEGVKGAGTVEKLLHNGKYLTAILIGNNFTNALVTALAASIVSRRLGNSGASVMLTTVFTTVLILVIGEITPKTVAMRHAEKVGLRVAAPIRFFTILMTPVSYLLNVFSRLTLKALGSGRTEAASVTESEIKTLVDVGLEEGVLDTGEQKMIHNVFEFGDSDAKDIMTPRTDMVALPDTATYSEAMAVFREERFSRVPVYKNDIDHIVGVLHFKDFIFSGADEKSFNIYDYMREPYFSYETKLTSVLFTEMRAQNVGIAVILDEYGGTSGIVSLEDLVEEIVGEIYDEDDEDEGEEIELAGEGEYIVDGGANLDDFNQALGLELTSDDYDTVGGYVMGVLGRIPENGDVASENGVTFLVDEVSKNRIEKLRVTLVEAEEQ